VPVALLATELASNSFKHGFPALRSGKIDIVIRALSGGGFELSVTDDGVGLMPAPSRRGSGLDIARALARQVGGSLSVESRPEGGVRATCAVAPQ
jgi:two-component sensor histidine kinase